MKDNDHIASEGKSEQSNADPKKKERTLDDAEVKDRAKQILRYASDDDDYDLLEIDAEADEEQGTGRKSKIDGDDLIIKEKLGDMEDNGKIEKEKLNEAGDKDDMAAVAAIDEQLSSFASTEAGAKAGAAATNNSTTSRSHRVPGAYAMTGLRSSLRSPARTGSSGPGSDDNKSPPTRASVGGFLSEEFTAPPPSGGDSTLSTPLDAHIAADEEEAILQRKITDRTIEATSVVKVEQMEQAQKEGNANQENKTKKKKLIFVMVMTTIVLIAVVVAIVLAATDRDHDDHFNDESDGVNDYQSSDKEDYSAMFQSLITEVSEKERFENETSPQSKALKWLINVDTFIDPSHLLGDIDDVENIDALKAMLLERYAVAVLYYSTNGDGADGEDGWYSHYGFLAPDLSVCDWNGGSKAGSDGIINQLAFGISCNDNDSVTRIKLDSNNLRGTLPSELSALASLEELSFEFCSLGGTLPESIGSSLTRLEVFNVAWNGLITGSIPESFVNLRKLELFNAAGNGLVGTIPTEILYSENMEHLNLGYNYLTGSIVPTATDVESSNNNMMPGLDMQNLQLEVNMLTGSIPNEIYSMTQLERLYLWQNEFTGTISTNVGQLSSVYDFDYGINQLTGTLPSEIGFLSNLEYMYFGWNLLSGNLPSEIAQANRLIWLWLNDNQFTGSIPEELSTLRYAENIRFFNNSLVGDLSSSFCSDDAGTLFATVDADCGGESPLVECPCCVTCCDPHVTGACTVNHDTVCNIEARKFTHPRSFLYYGSGGTECGCSDDNPNDELDGNGNGRTSLSCIDTNCQSCNTDKSVCAVGTYGYTYKENGLWETYTNAFEYTMGRNDTVIFQKNWYDDWTYDCEVTLNGQKCNTCVEQTCLDGFTAYQVNCENVDILAGGTGVAHNGGKVDLCNPTSQPNYLTGPLTVFSIQDPAYLTGCTPRFPQLGQ